MMRRLKNYHLTFGGIILIIISANVLFIMSDISFSSIFITGNCIFGIVIGVLSFFLGLSRTDIGTAHDNLFKIKRRSQKAWEKK